MFRSRLPNEKDSGMSDKPRMRKRFLDCSGMTIEEAESYGHGLAEQQRDVMFQIGDLARYSEARWPDTHHQVWPEWISHEMLARAAGTVRAYLKEEERQWDCTYTQYMQNAGRPDRQERLAAIVEKGLTSDESRSADAAERHGHGRWLLAIDVPYYLSRFWHSGAGVTAAKGVADWIARTADRLKNDKGLTDVVCCFDSPINYRKHMTAEWEDKYKDRPPKDPEWIQQLILVRELISGEGFACVMVEGWEADDVLASYAHQFDGRVTLLTSDKDCKQCLSGKCNMLLDVELSEEPMTGQMTAVYKWLSAREHLEATGLKDESGQYIEGSGIRPDQWMEYQCIMGDRADNIKGAIGIGEKGAADLIREFGSVDLAIAAAKDGDDRIRPANRQALIDLDAKLEVTRALVTLRTDLEIPRVTRI